MGQMKSFMVGMGGTPAALEAKPRQGQLPGNLHYFSSHSPPKSFFPLLLSFSLISFLFSPESKVLSL